METLCDYIYVDPRLTLTNTSRPYSVRWHRASIIGRCRAPCKEAVSRSVTSQAYLVISAGDTASAGSPGQRTKAGWHTAAYYHRIGLLASSTSRLHQMQNDCLCHSFLQLDLATVVIVHFQPYLSILSYVDMQHTKNNDAEN